MISAETQQIIDRAKAIYETIRPTIERDHADQFVSIEPESAEYFIADTFDDAVKAASTAYPTRLSHTIRVGHAAAFSIGVMTK